MKSRRKSCEKRTYCLVCDRTNPSDVQFMQAIQEGLKLSGQFIESKGQSVFTDGLHFRGSDDISVNLDLCGIQRIPQLLDECDSFTHFYQICEMYILR